MNLSTRSALHRFAVPVGILATVVGCESASLVSPSPSAPLLAGDEDVSPFPEEVTVCKTGPLGTSATFDVTRDGPFGNLTTPVTVQAMDINALDLSKCATVWRSTNVADPLMNVTISERPQAGIELQSIVALTDYYGTQTILNPVTPSYTVPVNWNNGAFVIFKNIEADIPGGGEGCTPGYWKVKPHQDSWAATGYSQGQLFDDVFGRPAFPGMNLLDVLWQGGGHLKALGRHTVAALLNAAHPDVSYDLTSLDVITSFQNAFDSGIYEPTKNGFEAFNESGCPID